jgi:hypothetical protein
MFVDYTDLNKASPKEAYSLPNIDKLVDKSSGYKLKSFMNAYIYNVMPFGLQNAGATYKRMMNKIFRDEIGDMLEVYIDDMIVKSTEEYQHKDHMETVFTHLRHYNMRLNPVKCTFEVKATKFMGFYLIERGIEANPEKCRDVLCKTPIFYKLYICHFQTFS